MTKQEQFMAEAIALSQHAVDSNTGGPFGCVVVKNGEIIGKGQNRVTSNNDPTAHAEVEAIRDACKNIQSFDLHNCEIYTSCEPCPMCLGAIYWARPKIVYYGNTHSDAASIGFDDSMIYGQVSKPINERSIPMENLLRSEAFNVFKAWENKENRKPY